MARITVEDCLAIIPNRFSLVLVTAERTKQLMKGSRVMIDDDRSNKEIVTALREIAAGSIHADMSGFDENEQVGIQAAQARGGADLPPSVDDLLPPAADDLPPEA
jgi:DNA-directed RNA polymerase subunit omega